MFRIGMELLDGSLVGMSMKHLNATVLQRLQDWYASQCNDNWEHVHGVKIDTLDNPGWSVRIDLADTAWSKLKVDRVLVERTDSDWINYEIDNCQFVGQCGPQNLSELLERFFSLTERLAILSQP